MGAEIDAAGFEALQIQLLHVVWRGLQNHLKLLMLEQPVGILAESSVRRSTRRLHVGHVPVRRTEHAQKGLGMHCAGAHFNIERLLEQAAPGGPEFRELEDELLKRDHSI